MQVAALVRLDLIFLRHQIEGEVSSLTHLGDLFVNKELQVVVLLVFEVFSELVNLLLEIFIHLLDIADLLTEELSLLRELLFCCELARKCIMHKGHNQVSDVLDIVDEHHIAQLFFHIVVTTLLGQVVLLIAL